MSRFQNLKYEEIAQVLGCPVNTVKARVFRAIKDLKTYFDDQNRAGTDEDDIKNW